MKNSKKAHRGKARGVILVVKMTLSHLWLPTATNLTTNNQSNTDRQADLHYRETKNLYPKKLRTLTSKERFEELSYLVAQLLWRWFGVANITHQAREIAAGNGLWITQGILNGEQKPRVLVLNIGQPGLGRLYIGLGDSFRSSICLGRLDPVEHCNNCWRLSHQRRLMIKSNRTCPISQPCESIFCSCWV